MALTFPEEIQSKARDRELCRKLHEASQKYLERAQELRAPFHFETDLNDWDVTAPIPENEEDPRTPPEFRPQRLIVIEGDRVIDVRKLREDGVPIKTTGEQEMQQEQINTEELQKALAEARSQLESLKQAQQTVQQSAPTAETTNLPYQIQPSDHHSKQPPRVLEWAGAILLRPSDSYIVLIQPVEWPIPDFGEPGAVCTLTFGQYQFQIVNLGVPFTYQDKTFIPLGVSDGI